MFEAINLKNALQQQRSKWISEENMLEFYKNIFHNSESEGTSILHKLNSKPTKTENNFDFDKLDTKAIFHITDIKKICVDYRLRFLDTVYFKDVYPAEAISKIQILEKKHQTKLGGFKIIAPMEVFKLKKADDPLLFAPMGNGFYYLIHQWGNDVSPFRKLKYWAIKNIENLAVTLAILSIALTAISYPIFFTKPASFGYLLMLFMFYFKGVVGLVFIFCGSSGKNFSEYSWQSQYDKIS
ncbi:hypothetical protein [Polaribacter sp.]|uniref:hypothetical protein n=1 Tax=Polaribacter sp. TaxID=1920175 RepID=UPI003F6BC99A